MFDHCFSADDFIRAWWGLILIKQENTMWIIPKNYPLFSAFAQDMVASKEDLTLPGLSIESSLMWRSKPSQLRTWLQRWKRMPWFQRLSIRILKPSQRKSFETKLTSLLVDIPANHFQQQGNEKAKTTPDTYGLTSENTSEQLDLIDACLKTSRDISVLDSEKSLQTWKKTVTDARSEYSARKKLAHRTDGSECLSWPTPTLAEVSGGMRLKQIKEGKWHNIQLREKIALLEEKKLQDNWPTPRVGGEEGLDTLIERKGLKKAIQHNLKAAVEYCETTWPTPSAHEARLGYQDRSDPTKKGTQESLTTVAVNKAGGRKKCQGHLNPDWVEQLMGLPPGWTSLDGTCTEWQYGWHDGNWEADIPRVVESCDDRVDRIRLLGNGVVPATAAKAFITLTERQL